MNEYLLLQNANIIFFSFLYKVTSQIHQIEFYIINSKLYYKNNLSLSWYSFVKQTCIFICLTNLPGFYCLQTYDYVRQTKIYKMQATRYVPSDFIHAKLSYFSIQRHIYANGNVKQFLM